MSERSKHLVVPTAELPAGAARSDLPFELPVRLGLPVAQAPALRATRISGPLRDVGGCSVCTSLGRRSCCRSPRQARRARPVFDAGTALAAPPIPHRQRGDCRRDRVDRGGAAAGWPARGLLCRLLAVGTGTLTVGGAAIAAAGSGAGAAGGATLTYTGALHADLDVTLGSSALVANDAGSACGAVVNPSLRIVWSSGGTPTLTLGAASATFAGTTFTLDPYVGPPSLDSGLGAILFPFTINPATWDSAGLSGAIVTFSGTTTLTGGWALSLVQPTASAPLGEALGAGECVFYCQDAIRASWAGGASLALRDVKLVVRQGQLVLVAPQAAANSEASQRLSLWGVQPDPDGPRLPLTLRFGAAGCSPSSATPPPAGVLRHLHRRAGARSPGDPRRRAAALRRLRPRVLRHRTARRHRRHDGAGDRAGPPIAAATAPSDRRPAQRARRGDAGRRRHSRRRSRGRRLERR